MLVRIQPGLLNTRSVDLSHYLGHVVVFSNKLRDAAAVRNQAVIAMGIDIDPAERSTTSRDELATNIDPKMARDLFNFVTRVASLGHTPNEAFDDVFGGRDG